MIYADLARQQLKTLDSQAGLTASQGQTNVPSAILRANAPAGGAELLRPSRGQFQRQPLLEDFVRARRRLSLPTSSTWQRSQPTELQQGNVTADVADPSVKRNVESRGQEFAGGLTLMLDGQRLPLRLLSSQLIFPPGAGGLPTMKMGFVYQARCGKGGELQIPPLRSFGAPRISCGT